MIRQAPTIATLLDWFVANPIIYNELIRSLRRLRYFILMALLLSVGTLILCLLWSTPFYGQFPAGRVLFFSVIAGQAAVILLLLPGYVSQSVITERDRDTLPLLLTTPLGAGRILFGKMVSTLGMVLLLLISTYPLASVCMARGGVSPVEAITSIVWLLTAAFASSAFAVYHSLYARTVLRAIFMTQFSLFLAYVMGAALGMFLIGVTMSLVAILAQIAQWPLQQSWAYIFTGSLLLVLIPMALALPIALLFIAAQRLRYLEPRIPSEWDALPEVAFQLGQNASPNLSPSGNKRRFGEWRLEDGDNPFYYRERKSQAVTISIWAIPSWYFIAIIAYHLLLITPIQEGRWLIILSLLFIAQMAPAYAAPLIAGERENDSWDLLITTLTRAQPLLNGKLWAALQPCLQRWAALTYTPIVILFLANALVFIVTGARIPAISLTALLMYTLIMATQLVFLTLLGVWFSARSERTGVALIWTYGLAVAFYFAPLLLDEVASLWLSLEFGLVLRAFSPILMAYDVYTFPAGFVAQLGFHLGIYWVLSVALYYLAQKRLERDHA